MIRRPPRSTRTDTLFPYTTLFRSGHVEQLVERAEDRIHELGSGLLVLIVVVEGGAVDRKTTVHQLRLEAYFIVKQRLLFDGRVGIEDGARKMWRASRLITLRSEGRRVGKACVSKCRSRWSPDY